MGFFSFIVLLAIAYLIWRVTDQLPDLIFRLSEIQRDVAEIRRRLADQGPTGGQADSATPGATAPAAAAPTAPASATPVTPPPGSASPGPASPSSPAAPPVGGETGADYTRS